MLLQHFPLPAGWWPVKGGVSFASAANALGALECIGSITWEPPGFVAFVLHRGELAYLEDGNCNFSTLLHPRAQYDATPSAAKWAQPIVMTTIGYKPDDGPREIRLD